MTDPRHREATDFYELLQISPNASPEVVQAAYRALVRTYHPDVNASADAQRIMQLNAAYTVLSDPEQRAQYDLECARMRRHKRVVSGYAEPSTVTSAVAGPRRRPQTFASLTTASSRGPEVRLALLNGQIVLALIATAALALIFIILIWATLDAASDPVPGYSPPNWELVPH